MKTVTISKAEYTTLKKKAQEKDDDLLTQFVNSLEDIRTGRFKPWKPKFLK